MPNISNTTNMIVPSIPNLLSAIETAAQEGMMHHPPTGILSGFSGEKLIGTLQRLSALFADDGNNCYLEVGVFQGMTLLSTAGAAPSMACYGIDNFAFFDPDNKNKSLVQSRREKLAASNAHLIDMDYEDALADLGKHIGTKKVAVYFIDGPHDYRSQRVCLDLIIPYLHPNGVIVIDDCNYEHVRQANHDFLIANPDFKMLFDAYTPSHPVNMDQHTEAEARKGWWDGVNIIAKDPENSLQTMLPPTNRNRQLFENDHHLHPSGLAQQLPQIVQFANEIKSRPLPGRIRSTVRLYRWLTGMPSDAPSEHYRSLNTRSEKLPNQRLNHLNTGNR